MSLSAENAVSPVSGENLLKRQGSMWSYLSEDKQAMEDLSEIRALSLREETDHQRSLNLRHQIHEASDFAYSARSQITLKRVSKNPPTYAMPRSIVSLTGLFSGSYKEHGRDFIIENGRIRFFEPIDLGDSPRVYARGVYRFVGDVTGFWSKLLGQPTPETSWGGMYRNLYDGLVAQPSELQLRRLVAAVFEVPVVQHPGRVLHVRTDKRRPIIVTDKETLVGAIDDTPAVAVNALVAPGDLVFESVRFHDFSCGKAPSWISVLRIPPRYFIRDIAKPIEFSNLSQSVTATTVGNRIRIRFPITADDSADAVAFWAFVDTQEIKLGYGLAQLLTNHPRPTIDMIPSTCVPLSILWSLWLNLGVSVSVVRIKPTTEHLGRLALLRRLVPPWLTHFIHFDQTEPRPYDFLC